MDLSYFPSTNHFCQIRLFTQLLQFDRQCLAPHLWRILANPFWDEWKLYHLIYSDLRFHDLKLHQVKHHLISCECCYWFLCCLCYWAYYSSNCLYLIFKTSLLIRFHLSVTVQLLTQFQNYYFLGCCLKLSETVFLKTLRYFNTSS
jgi:hypothetical protein